MRLRSPALKVGNPPVVQERSAYLAMCLFVGRVMCGTADSEDFFPLEVPRRGRLHSVSVVVGEVLVSDLLSGSPQERMWGGAC